MFENVSFEIKNINFKNTPKMIKPIDNETLSEAILRVYLKNEENIHVIKIVKSRKIFRSNKYKINHTTGIPDFYYKSNNEIIFVECKEKTTDGLRYSQIEWIKNNPQYKVRVIWVDIKDWRKK